MPPARHVVAHARNGKRRSDHARGIDRRAADRRAVVAGGGGVGRGGGVHVPDADVPGRRPDGTVRLAGGLRGHIGILIGHRENDVVRKGRDAHPDERLAVRVPRVDLAGEGVALRIREGDVRAVRRAVGVGETGYACGRNPHENGEILKRRRARVARNRDLRRLAGHRKGHGSDQRKRNSWKGELLHVHVYYSSLMVTS